MQRKYKKLNLELQHNHKPSIALMGLAFKPNIDDYKVFKLIHYQEVVKKADIVAFLVAHKEFKNLNLSDDKVVLDFCRVTM